MQKIATIVVKENSWIEIAGTLNCNTVIPIHEKALALISELSEIKVELSRIDNCDSAALALLTSMFRQARRQKKQILFYNLPQFLQDLARVSSLDVVLPIKTAYNMQP